MRFAETEVFLRESIENGIFTRFIFTDDNKSENLIKLLGAEALVGTAPSSNPENASTKAWAADYIAEYGAGASPAQRPSAIGPREPLGGHEGRGPSARPCAAMERGRVRVQRV